MIDIAAIKLRYDAVRPVLDERGRRRFAAAEALAAGWGGIAAVSEATGIARSTIGYGLRELRGSAADSALGGIRRKGAGRKPLTQTDPTLLRDLERLVDPATRGDPMSPLKWTSKSLRNLAAGLCAMGHRVGYDVVGTLLKRLGYSLQGNRKTLEGSNHVDRDAQFQHIAQAVGSAIAADQPAISVDTKKKELVGDFKNGGREYQPAGSPEPVRVHDFIDPQLGRAAPYGVYDIAGDKGWVSVGIDHDTAAFAVNAIRSWWTNMGRDRYANAHTLTITADGGGSNGSRVRLWKIELQKLADELGLTIAVLHFPPGTSRWNKIEHRLFSFISRNWRGRPLTEYRTIVELIGATTSTAGLTVRCELDETSIPPGSKSHNEELAPVNIIRNEFHGDWNYTIKPKEQDLER
ncbi:ISAzo13 family transposase [Rhizobium leguminosarum]|uniref:ISAzo13 family transposase n=1 Tax=Rhizobium leguminosarum TaxID=384 RepID=A0A6P0DU26_RHILE|nr:ISAzo13 family transposase [Rhizobium leguminosarum]NEJ25825.1 ISAzo13 family transposase [Rhizobium leguminosarum]NEK54836.1 ISAzo13 family transposase [Rhizobium leguminosarum]